MFQNSFLTQDAGQKFNYMNTHEETVPTGTFDGLGIAPKLLEILDRIGYKSPTPIQQQSIPIAIQGKDVMGIAQTGTGKTLAFGIPMLQNLVNSKRRGLVVLPTRELALQVEEELQKIGRPIGLKTAVLIGGENISRQIRALRDVPHILIVTPGRLIDHMEQGTVKLDRVGVLVLDEADRMLDMGFAPQLKKIMTQVPADHQTMLFSATMPPEILHIASTYLKLPIRVEVSPPGTTINKIVQELIFVQKADKLSVLKKILSEHNGSVLVFTRTKHGAGKVALACRTMGHTAAEIHSNRSLNQRIEALKGFKVGKYRVLVATDIAARGIDVTGIEVVVNFDLPGTAEDYVHRIGRTGRAGHEGRAISLATPDQRADVRDIERLIKKALPISKVSLPAGQGMQMPPDDRDRERAPHQFRRDAPSRYGDRERAPQRDQLVREYGRRTQSGGRHPAGQGYPPAPSKPGQRRPSGRFSSSRPPSRNPHRKAPSTTY